MPDDPGLARLLELDGTIVDVGGGYWVKLSVRRVPASPDRPQGINYSFTLHDQNGTRVLGYDNAHRVAPRGRRSRRRGVIRDHRHSGDRSQPYVYKDAETLITDFWNDVYRYLESQRR